MNLIDSIKRKIEDAKEKRAAYYSWQSRYERLKDSEQNKQARKAFQKELSQISPETQLTEEQEGIIFSQKFHLLFLKNPEAAKFPEFDDYEIQKNDETYTIKGYCDSTNSYGAQVREKHEYEVYKHENEWTCITDIGTKFLKWILLIVLLIALPAIIASCSISSISF